jgi:hypothetical protein
VSWREKTVVGILLLIARMLDEGQWSAELKSLATNISLYGGRA